MELALLVYLIGTVLPVLSGIGAVLLVITCVLGVIWVAGAPYWLDDDYEEYRNNYFKATKSYLVWAVPIIFVCSLIPSKEVSYTMVAAYTAQSIGSNEKVQDITGQSLEVIEAFLVKAQDELKEENVEK